MAPATCRICRSRGTAASFPAAPPSLDAALNYADDLMYQAKRAGKNRVVHAGFAGIDPAIERRLKETT